MHKPTHMHARACTQTRARNKENLTQCVRSFRLLEETAFYKHELEDCLLSKFPFLSYKSSFHEMTKRIYVIETQAENDTIAISVPENVTQDVAGNKNMASNVLQVKHCKDLILLLVSRSFIV